jgi:short-subunit dehydrogenase
MADLAVVTGASSGIGEAYAELLARKGWNLLLMARRLDRLEALAARLTAEQEIEVRVAEADLSRHADVDHLCRELEALPVAMLVNNAGLAHYMPFAQLPPEQAEELVHLNVLAPVLLTRAVIPGMRDRARGAIINVASLLAFSGAMESPNLPRRAVYAASKAFLVTFTQILASELRDTGVRVQVVCPGVVRSEFHSRQGFDMSTVDRMEPEAIARASLLDLEGGVVVSVPGVPDESVVEGIAAASSRVQAFTRTVDLPSRYQ